MEVLEPTSAPRATGLRRWLYVGLGCLFVALGVLGAILPVLPATPFFLLASWFFVRSSPALHERLLRSRFVGLFLRDWAKHRAVHPRVKRSACVVIVLMVGASAMLANLSWPMLSVLLVLGMIGLTVVMRLPVIPQAALAPVVVEELSCIKDARPAE